MKNIFTGFFQISVLPIVFITAMVHYNFAMAQEVKKEHKPLIRGALMMANTHVPMATEQGKEVFAIPTWGADIDYFYHPRWSFALQADIKLQSFEVKEGSGELTRSYPFSLAGVLHFHLKRHWSFYAGPGYEFEKHENLWIAKFGSEYSIEVNENFEVALNFIYENKQEKYDNWTFGVAFNRKLWQKK